MARIRPPATAMAASRMMRRSVSTVISQSMPAMTRSTDGTFFSLFADQPGRQVIQPRHCEPKAQSSRCGEELDCFVAALLAMTPSGRTRLFVLAHIGQFVGD